MTADKILQQYKARNPTEDVVLRSNGRIVGDDTMKMLDVYGDQIIAFEAVKKSDMDQPTATAMPRKPLHPSGRQISQTRVLTPEPASSAAVKKENKSTYPGAKVHGHFRSPSKAKPRMEDAYPHHARDENIPPTSTFSPLAQLASVATTMPALSSVPHAFGQASNEGVPGPYQSEAAGWKVNEPFMRYLQVYRRNWPSHSNGLAESDMQSKA